MREILVACGDIDTLKQIIAALPAQEYKPVATKRGADIAQKIAPRGITQAIVHDTLEDGATERLLSELHAHSPHTKVLLLCSDTPPKDGPFHIALRYPVPAPVLRNAVGNLDDSGGDEHDLETWRLFFRELKAKNQQAPSQSYYQLVNLPQDAPHHHIIKAFDLLSLRYHPDRYDQIRSERWGQAIYDESNALYKLITEAYNILADRQLRAKYDKALGNGELRLDQQDTNLAQKSNAPRSLVDIGTTQQSKRFLKLAQSDIAAQRFGSARQNLKFAQSMEPDNEDIRLKIAELQQHD